MRSQTVPDFKLSKRIRKVSGMTYKLQSGICPDT